MRQTLKLAFAGLLAVSTASAVRAQPADATPDPTAGKRLFLRCASCHSVAEGPDSKIGPNLRTVVGRATAALPDYGYSPAMKAAHLTWDDATLDRWLVRPEDVVPGTSMAFAGMPKPEDRQALIAYLKSTSQ